MRRWLLLAMVPVSILVPAAAPSTPQPGVLPPACVDPRGCPDLTTVASAMNPRLTIEAFGPSSCDVVEGMVEAGTRKLVRFTFTTPNRGHADLIVGPPWLRSDLFVYHGCHGHYHFREYADYRLWTPDQFAAWSALREEFPDLTPAQILSAHPELAPVQGGKRGFCVVDLRRYSYGPFDFSKYNSCQFQGISAGWADEYHYSLSGQYVDVTGLASGDYVLEAEVNAERLFQETDYANNRAWVSMTI